VLLITAAAVAGAAISHAAWPPSRSVNAAGAESTTPTTGAGTVPGPGLSPNYGSSPFSYGYGPGGSGSGSGSAEGAGGPSDVSAIAAKVDQAVVDINVTLNYQDAEGAGTGIVLTSNGEVLTNNHVVDGATKISVTDVGNGRTYSASVVGYDIGRDIAVLQLQGASGLKTAKLATSQPSIGEAVVAIGNAGGAGGTPTSAGGSITALGQSISASDELTGSSEQLTGLIEVNANVEAGDSGGPLVNAAGQVIGMDTAASQSFAFSAQGNAGFAIPASVAMAIANDIEASQASATVHIGSTAFLGVLVGSAADNPFYGQISGGPGSGTTGVEVNNVVNGGPAQSAGIGAGDLIISLGGQAVTSPSQLTKLLIPHHPGQKVQLGWEDQTGQSHTTTVTLASGPPA
jgi:S1-C subfamily serine protease